MTRNERLVLVVNRAIDLSIRADSIYRNEHEEAVIMAKLLLQFLKLYIVKSYNINRPCQCTSKNPTHLPLHARYRSITSSKSKNTATASPIQYRELRIHTYGKSPAFIICIFIQYWLAIAAWAIPVNWWLPRPQPLNDCKN